MDASWFWYARILGIYHANVYYQGSTLMDFLWVQWLTRITDIPGGWGTCLLDRVRYPADPQIHHAYDSIDPIDITQAAHPIPRSAKN
jgi:hypothetical protein